MASTGRATRSQSQAGNKRKDIQDDMEEAPRRQAHSTRKELATVPEERQEQALDGRHEEEHQKVRRLPICRSLDFRVVQSGWSRPVGFLRHGVRQ